MITENDTLPNLEDMNIGDVKRLADQFGLPVIALLEASVALTAAKARTAARHLLEVGDRLERAELEAAGQHVWDIPSDFRRDQPKSGYLIETSHGTGGREPFLCVEGAGPGWAARSIQVGSVWDSNWGVKLSKQLSPAEFTFRCLAKVRFISETVAGTRWVEVPV